MVIGALPTLPVRDVPPVREVLVLGQMTVNKVTFYRRKCYDQIARHPQIGSLLHHRFDVFQEADWQRLAVAAANGTVFLNLHRMGPPTGQPVESLRIASLLTIGAAIVTDDASAIDLSDYDGMLLVEPHLCTAGANWTEDASAMLHGSMSPAALDAWRQRAHRLFRVAFAPAAMLHRAGVWGRRDDDNGGASCTSHI